MKKLCSKCVLTVDQKQLHLDDLERRLQLSERNKNDFLPKCVTIDETSTHHFSQIGSRLSGQQQVKVVQSDQRRKHQQARFWPPYFGMCKVFYLSIALRILHSIIGAFEGRNRQKRPQMKSAFEPRQCTVSQVDRNDGKTTRIDLRIASAPTLLPISGPQRLLAVFRP